MEKIKSIIDVIQKNIEDTFDVDNLIDREQAKKLILKTMDDLMKNELKSRNIIN